MPGKVVDSTWFTGPDWCVGVVLTHDGFLYRAYIGGGKGRDQKTDEEMIAAYGKLLTLRQVLAFFPDIDTSKYTEHQS